ncbi:hypothetical protein QYF36_004997 [Acer negundo]|nr:hypothetical protein QYF36_004997 [Acer negundo]
MTSKKFKITNGKIPPRKADEDDMVSKISHIFSYLDAVDVMRTMEVSKTWVNLWNSIIVSLLTTITLFGEDKTSRDMTITQTLSYGIHGDNSVNQLMDIMTRRNVQEFSLNVRLLFVKHTDHVELPKSLNRCASLSHLRVHTHSGVLRLPNLNCLKGLESLHLLDITFEDFSVFRNFVSGLHNLMEGVSNS